MKKSELYASIREMVINELSEAENPNPTQAREYADQMERAADETERMQKALKEEDVNEMAFIKGPKAPEGLEAAITAVVKSNSDAELKDIRKAIKADEKVISALKKAEMNVKDDLADNQLNKFIELIRGNREVGQRGRKADPDKPAKEKGTRGRPKSATPAAKKEKVAKFVTSKLNKSYTTDDEEGPSDKELKQLARSGGELGDKLTQLRQQEKTKMIRAFLKDMQSKGVVDSANRVLDKDAYAKEWADAKVDIEAKVKAIK